MELTNWQLTKALPGSAVNPNDLDHSNWEAAKVPATVARHYYALGNEPPPEMDNYDWWFTADSLATKNCNSFEITFHGLAPLTEIWLNGALLTTCNTMFMPLTLEVTLQEGINTWHLCFRSLGAALKIRRPRPKWKTPLLEQQQLRWFRTSLIGRMTGWNKPFPIIGPWGSIICTEKSSLVLQNKHLTTGYKPEQKQGWISAKFEFKADVSNPCSARLEIADSIFNFELDQCKPGIWIGNVDANLSSIEPWWPHTHGAPHLYGIKLIVLGKNNETIEFELGQMGFKSVDVDKTDGKHTFQINRQEIFCRGSVWTPQDVIGFSNDRERLRRSLSLAKEAGVNMLRINGTMNYESDDFFELCDEMGILVWQDFMFANMDYPTDDADFFSLVKDEVRHLLGRTSQHVCIAAYCGSNEAYMQAAMLGISPDSYHNLLFDDYLPAKCAEFHPDIPFFEGSPYGGDLPFLPETGTSHYYGVSAYMQPLSDAETSKVKFSSECLAFSNIPEPNVLQEIFKGKIAYTHDPLWKQGVPRGAKSGWDFEDVRDFYLKSLYKIDPLTLRYKDTLRYMEISRVLTGDIMEETIALWRSNYTPCMGALTWLWQDLYPGAGWGLLDSSGHPKAAYYCFKRACQPCAVFLIDRGLNGLYSVVVNDSSEKKSFRVEIKGFNSRDAQTFDARQCIEIDANSQEKFCVDNMVGHFNDFPHVYRFGPVQHSIVHARLFDIKDESFVSEHFYFPEKSILYRQQNPNITINIKKSKPGLYTVDLCSCSFVQWVRLDIPGFIFSNNYFHLAPNQDTTVKASSEVDKPLKGYVEAMNLQESIRINEN